MARDGISVTDSWSRMIKVRSVSVSCDGAFRKPKCSGENHASLVPLQAVIIVFRFFFLPAFLSRSEKKDPEIRKANCIIIKTNSTSSFPYLLSKPLLLLRCHCFVSITSIVNHSRPTGEILSDASRCCPSLPGSQSGMLRPHINLMMIKSHNYENPSIFHVGRADKGHIVAH
jgi:hypothetical protein